MIHGLEDTCSDDALWLIASIVEYVKETGEYGFFDEIITYADGGSGTVYENMKKILDFSAKKKGATPGRPSWNSPDGWSRKPIPLRICAIVRAVYYL